MKGSKPTRGYTRDYFELNHSRYLPVRFIFIYDIIRQTLHLTGTKETSLPRTVQNVSSLTLKHVMEIILSRLWTCETRKHRLRRWKGLLPPSFRSWWKRWSNETEWKCQMQRQISDRTSPTIILSGPPRKVDYVFRNFTSWAEQIYSVSNRNFRKFLLNESRPDFAC